jgi:ssDNA-binding Zn-finger/Zn-ribbon topoisomerase 1
MNTKTTTSKPVESKDENICPKCGAPMAELSTTKTGRKLRRCSAGSWNPQTHKTDGCDYVLWMPFEPETLDEKCPKCGSPLILSMTRFGKKMKKCSTGGWDKATKTATGCDYVEWINGTTVALDEECPDCGAKLVLYTTAAGKKMKKCSTGGWDREKKQATGCTYVKWLKPGEDTGEEFLPPES